MQNDEVLFEIGKCIEFGKYKIESNEVLVSEIKKEHLNEIYLDMIK